jgi:two-component system, cell cycle response regulator
MDLWRLFLHFYYQYPTDHAMNQKILSIDDSKTIRLLLARMFRPFQVELREAGNGEEGLAQAKEVRPDLIILDYNMPVMDGVTMLQHLRHDPQLKSIPVIMLTAESNPKIISTVARLGVRDYIVKPFQEEPLLAKVNKVIPLHPQVTVSSIQPSS